MELTLTFMTSTRQTRHLSHAEVFQEQSNTQLRAPGITHFNIGIGFMADEFENGVA